MKKIISLLLVIALSVSLAACGSKEVSVEATTEPTTESTTATVVPTVATTVEATESAEVEVDYASVAAMLEASGAKMHYWNVDVLGEVFFINFAYNGMSDAVKMFKEAGYDENHSEWISVKETMLSLYESNISLMKTLGVENPMCFLNLVNENNHGEIFVTIYNGEVTTDIMASK